MNLPRGHRTYLDLGTKPSCISTRVDQKLVEKVRRIKQQGYYDTVTVA